MAKLIKFFSSESADEKKNTMKLFSADEIFCLAHCCENDEISTHDIPEPSPFLSSTQELSTELIPAYKWGKLPNEWDNSQLEYVLENDFNSQDKVLNERSRPSSPITKKIGGRLDEQPPSPKKRISSPFTMFRTRKSSPSKKEEEKEEDEEEKKEKEQEEKWQSRISNLRLERKKSDAEVVGQQLAKRSSECSNFHKKKSTHDLGDDSSRGHKLVESLSPRRTFSLESLSPRSLSPRLPWRKDKVG